MSTIYVVTQGDYSDYHICGVYSTEENATRAAELFSRANQACDVEEYELDILSDCPNGMLPYIVLMEQNGNAAADRISAAQVPREWKPFGDGLRVCFEMYACSETHAIKIANERRLQLIASGEWTTDREAWRKQTNPPDVLERP